MNARTIRRAAERKAAKLAKKAAALESAGQNHDQAGRPHPVSPAMQAANEANAKRSTGPITTEGKAVSSRNHTTHGLTAEPASDFRVLPTENQNAYDASLAGYRREWNPQTATEHDLVHRMATHAWLRDRAIRLQNQILEQVGDELVASQRKDFALYLRYQNTHARAYSKAFSEIMRLKNFQTNQRRAEAIQQKRVIDAQNRFESQKQRAELHAAKIELLHLRQEAIKQRNQKALKSNRTTETDTTSAAAQL